MEKQRASKSDWLRQHRARFVDDDNLLGVGVGPKEQGGRVLKERPAVKFFVRRKQRDVSPEKELKIDGEVTDVVQMAPLRARGQFVQRVRPGVGGCSGCVVVHDMTYTGTLGLGMRGYGRHADRTFILSNNHVLANENRARIGDPVIQPGSLDGGTAPEDAIGELFDFVPLRFHDWTSNSSPPVNKVDAACALVTRFGDFTREIFWVGYPQGWHDRDSVEKAVASWESKVQKTGRTTGYTQGEITAVNYDGWVSYDSGSAYFEDQMLISPGSFSDAGDSGSCIVDMHERIVGLLFAGGATHTIANYIEDVWSLLGPIDFSDGMV